LESNRFALITTLITLAYACYVGIYCNAMLANALERVRHSPTTRISHRSEAAHVVVLFCFDILFIAELVLRIAVLRSEFFLGEGCGMNLLDAACVLYPLRGCTRRHTDVPTALWLRVLRLFRFVMVYEYFKSPLFIVLRMVVNVLVNSVWTFLTAAILGLVFTYMFALCMCFNYASALNAASDAEMGQSLRLEVYFSRVSLAMKWIFLATSGGVAWNDVYQEVEAFSHADSSSFLAFMYVYFVGIMNITVAVIVAQAFAVIAADSDYRIVQHVYSMMRQRAASKAFHHEFEKDSFANYGKITFEALMSSFTSPRFEAHMKTMGVDTHGLAMLFGYLDMDGGGAVDLAELCAGIEFLKGGPSKIQHMCTEEQLRLLMKVHEQDHARRRVDTARSAAVVGHTGSVTNLQSERHFSADEPAAASSAR